MPSCSAAVMAHRSRASSRRCGNGQLASPAAQQASARAVLTPMQLVAHAGRPAAGSQSSCPAALDLRMVCARAYAMRRSWLALAAIFFAGCGDNKEVECDDGLFCNGIERLVDGTCIKARAN